MALAMSFTQHPPQSKTVHRRAEAVRPPLKWAGGKRWQVKFLREYWNRDTSRRLVEPFCGGLAVTLGLRPERALLNDINPHVVNFYRWLKRGLVIDLPMNQSETTYYAYRKRFNQLLADTRGETVEAASLFYYLNRTGYNGLCRFNASGGFNVPYGQYKTITYRKDFLEFKAVFANWEFSTSDSNKSRCSLTTSFTRTHHMTSSSLHTHRADSAGRNKNERPGGSPRMTAR